jgi:hypothetical protein
MFYFFLLNTDERFITGRLPRLRRLWLRLLNIVLAGLLIFTSVFTAVLAARLALELQF